jgi:hypothetical protein
MVTKNDSIMGPDKFLQRFCLRIGEWLMGADKNSHLRGGVDGRNLVQISDPPNDADLWKHFGVERPQVRSYEVNMNWPSTGASSF